MQLFSADATIVKKKNAPENMKNYPPKVAHNWFFLWLSLLNDHQSQQMTFC